MQRRNPVKTVSLPGASYLRQARSNRSQSKYNRNGQRYWKIYGPDLNGVHGGLQGIGGLEAVFAGAGGLGTAMVSDHFGNIVGTNLTVQTGSFGWLPTRFTSYGPVAGYQQPELSLNTPPPVVFGYLGKRVDETGRIYFGTREYALDERQWLSYDSMGWRGGHPYAYANGCPNYFYDPDGRFGKQVGQGAAKGIDFTWNLGLATFATPNPDGSTVEQRQALAQIAIQNLGSPMRRWIGAYDSPSPVAEVLPSMLGTPTQDAMMAYAATKAGTYSPDPGREMQWGAPLEEPAQRYYESEKEKGSTHRKVHFWRDVLADFLHPPRAWHANYALNMPGRCITS